MGAKKSEAKSTLVPVFVFLLFTAPRWRGRLGCGPVELVIDCDWLERYQATRDTAPLTVCAA